MLLKPKSDIKCPICRSDVRITHFEIEVGKVTQVSCTCDECGARFRSLVKDYKIEYKEVSFSGWFGNDKVVWDYRPLNPSER